MLIGRYSTKVGAKGRVAVPVKFREGLGKAPIISQGYEKSLLLVERDKWEELTGFLKNKPLTRGPARDTERFLFGSAFEVEFDSQGRIVVPQELREFAGLSDEAVFLGLGNRVEIWSKENWTEYDRGLKKNIEEIASKLSEQGHES